MISHSEHNFQACEFILDCGRFNDWAVTTAFYSAMHLFQEKLFPYTDSENGAIFHTFIEYHRDRKKKNPNTSKHQTMLDLVSVENAKLFPCYQQLYEFCSQARYHNYVVNDRKTKKAKSYLDQLRKHYNPPIVEESTVNEDTAKL